MHPTIEYLQEKFQYLNNQCFGGKLKPIPIVLSNASTFLGKLCYKRKIVLGIEHLTDFQIRISTRYDIEESEIIDTLLHEMIHYHIASSHIKDTSSHGRVFRQIMTDLNNRFGYHLSVTHHAQKDSPMARQQQEERTQKRNALKRHYIGVATLDDGMVCVVKAASTRVIQIDRLLRTSYRVKSIKWYGSISPFWNRYPNSITPKLYHIDATDLAREMQSAVPITFT